jgi:hypothetical protein
MGTVEDDDSLPSVGTSHPRLERVLAWIVRWWVVRRTAARVTRHRQAAWTRIAAAQDAQRPGHDVEHLPSRYGPAWRASR